MGEITDRYNDKLDQELGLGKRSTVEDFSYSSSGEGAWITVDGKEEFIPDRICPDVGLRRGQEVYIKRKDGKITEIKK